MQIVIKTQIHRGSPALWTDAKDAADHPEKIDPAFAGSVFEAHGVSIEEAIGRLPLEVQALALALAATKEHRIDRDGWWASIYERTDEDAPLTVPAAQKLAKQIAKNARKGTA